MRGGVHGLEFKSTLSLALSQRERGLKAIKRIYIHPLVLPLAKGLALMVYSGGCSFGELELNFYSSIEAIDDHHELIDGEAI